MNGTINIYKPKGMSSFQVVAAVKKICNTKKVGHTGTLDPMATGVLPICIGKATKLIDYIMQGVKTYRVEMKLGIITDTYDTEGETLKTSAVTSTKEQIIEAIMSFKGDILQVPPMYSALKVNGKRLYELARKGIEVERAARPITIFDIIILHISDDIVAFDVVCSKGTYIRSLCYDIGEKLGCGAVMTSLERRASGNFTVETAIKLEDLNPANVLDHVISLENLIKDLPPLEANEKFSKLLLNGVKIQDNELISNVKNETKYRVYDAQQKLIGIGLKTDNYFKILTLLI